MKRAAAQAIRSIAQLHRELAEAYERLAASEREREPERAPKSPVISDVPVSADCLNVTRRALRKKGIAA